MVYCQSRGQTGKNCQHQCQDLTSNVRIICLKIDIYDPYSRLRILEDETNNMDFVPLASALSDSDMSGVSDVGDPDKEAVKLLR